MIMNTSLLKDIAKPDTITTTVKVIFGVLLLVRIAKTSADLYFMIEDRQEKKQKFP